MKQEMIRLSAACALAFGALVGSVQAQEVVIRAATTLPDSDGALAQAYRVFADQVALRSGGAMTVAIFYGGTLGGDREIYEQIQDNSIQFTATSDGLLAGFHPPIQAVAIPFLFSSDRVALKFYNNGEVFAEMREGLLNAGLRVLNCHRRPFLVMEKTHRPSPAATAGKSIRPRQHLVNMDVTLRTK